MTSYFWPFNWHRSHKEVTKHNENQGLLTNSGWASFDDVPDLNRPKDDNNHDKHVDNAITSHPLLPGSSILNGIDDSETGGGIWKKMSVTLTDVAIRHHRNIADTIFEWKRSSFVNGTGANESNQKATIAMSHETPQKRGFFSGKYAPANMLDDEDMEVLVENNRQEIKTLKEKIKQMEDEYLCPADYYVKYDRRMGPTRFERIEDDDGSVDSGTFEKSDEYIKALLTKQHGEIVRLIGQLAFLQIETSHDLMW